MGNWTIWLILNHILCTFTILVDKKFVLLAKILIGLSCKFVSPSRANGAGPLIKAIFQSGLRSYLSKSSYLFSLLLTSFVFFSIISILRIETAYLHCIFV